MHVCFPFSLNANTANTHHQALGGDVEQKEEEKMKMELKEWHRLVLLTEHNLGSLMLVFYICGPSVHLPQPYILHKTLTHFHDRQLLLTLE